MKEFLVQWLPTIITILLWGGIFCARNWLKTKIVSSVQHGFDSKLEELRSELRSKEAEISSLRDTVLTGRNQRQILVEKRRIKAVENVWKGVVELQKFKGVSTMMASINFKNAAKEAPQNANVRRMFEIIGNAAPKIEEGLPLPPNPAICERPFVSPLAWAYFTALQTVIMGAFLRAKILEIGVSGADKFLNVEHEKNILKAALPHLTTFIDEHEEAGYHHLIEELEENLLKELSNILEGKGNDQQSLQQASEIMKEVDKVATERANTSKTE